MIFKFLLVLVCFGFSLEFSYATSWRTTEIYPNPTPLKGPTFLENGYGFMGSFGDFVDVPEYALPPQNYPALFRIPSLVMQSRPILLGDGSSYIPYSPIDLDAILPARACWAVPPIKPLSFPPKNYNGYLVLPNGLYWRPLSEINPRWLVYAWMCGNWKWRLVQSSLDIPD